MEFLKKVWNFLREDSWQSLMVVLLIALVVIKFFFFPLLSALTGTVLPLVIVESCSMYHHENGFEKTFTSSIYEENGISIEDTVGWDFQNGFSKGDVIFVVGAKDLEVGDVIIFEGGRQYPLIHRIVSVNDGVYSTKGDNYKTNNGQLESEKAIGEDQLIGKALFRVPAIGWAKLIFFEMGRDKDKRGLCSGKAGGINI
jgi:signal peptidase I